MMTFGSLFSGIGGFDLGLERAGMKCRWQVEIDSFRRSVLSKHWPNVRQWKDIKHLNPYPNLEKVDVICGGFPCPVISQAAHGNNTGEWLWPDFYRMVYALRPHFCLIENVNVLRGRGLLGILRDLAQIGYDAEWNVIPASRFGAPHKRARVWVVAYSDENCKSNRSFDAETSFLQGFDEVNRSWPDPPRNLSVDDGFPRRMVEAYGDAVVPQIVEWIGKRIQSMENL